MFCTYLTIYSGSKLPPFYIGCTKLKKIYVGYSGTIKSKKYKNIFNMEKRLNPHLFKTKIIKVFVDAYEAGNHEAYLHQSLNVGTNPLYINTVVSGSAYGHMCEPKPYNSARMKSTYNTHKTNVKKRLNKVKEASERVSKSKWINDGKKSLRVDVNSVDHYLTNGYVLGRISFKRPLVRYMHKGEKLVRVKECDIPKFEAEGYTLGYNQKQLELKQEVARRAVSNREAKKRSS